MTTKRERIARRLATAVLLAVLCLAPGGCRFLADEFVRLDVTPPGAGIAPDAPVTAADGRP